MKRFSLSLLLLLLPFSVSAELLTDTQLGGRLKSLNLYLERTPNADYGLVSATSFRLDLTGQLVHRYDFEISVEQQFLWSDPPTVVDLPDDSINWLVDGEHSWNRDGRFESQILLDRFNLRGEQAGIRWAVGRQAIGFGRISLFSPLDVIAPFSPAALDVDVRPGVDAVRLTHFYGLAGQVGGVAVFGDEPRHNSYLLTFGENLGNLDLLLLAGSLRDRPMAGIGLAGEIGPLGIKGEVSWYCGTRVGDPGGDLHDDFAIAALEGWYRFDNGLVLIGEYLYNGPGSRNSENYPQVAVSAPLTEGLSFLLGRNYLLLGPSYELHPLVTATGLLIHNLDDSSSLLRPKLAVSLSDNLQLDLFWAFAIGDKPRGDPQTGFQRLRSEFGAVGESGGLLMRCYF